MNVRAVIHTVVARHKALPFDFATSNCAHLACDAAAELLGRDAAARFRERLSDTASVVRLFVNEGWTDLSDMAASLFLEIPLAQARSGDWVYYETDDDRYGALGVVCGPQVVTKSRAGIGFVPFAQARRAYRVA